MVIAAAHEAFRRLTTEQLDAMYGHQGSKVLIDVKGIILDKKVCQAAGYLYWRL